jgi:hypothetical protein
MLMAQQPPLSTTMRAESTPADPLRLADGFRTSGSNALGTAAIDPRFRVGSVQSWQASVQRDLPASLTIIATYLGAKGSRLVQQYLPNTFPVGSAEGCGDCPAGFVYVTSGGRSIRHAAQIQLRRRLRSGLTASTQYTLSKSNDNAGAFTRPPEASQISASGPLIVRGPDPAPAAGTTIAQDWRDLDAEWGPSSFDQRHLVTAQLEYTTGMGVAGGALLSGTAGSLVKGWTLTAQLTAGSGLPLTPVYLTSVPGTGVTGTLRPDYVGAGGSPPPGYYLDPSAYAAPARGTWGNAGRGSARGPAQLSLNGGLSRTLLWGDRINMDWRLDATNLLNRVTYASVNAIVGSPQFGLPTRANPMRKLQTTIRVRF